MWLERFLKLIDRSPLGAAIEKRRRLLEYDGEPGRIYIENIRAFLGVPYAAAKGLCELAVREGFFDRCQALMCPNDDRVLFETCDDEPVAQAQLDCEICEGNEIEPHVFLPGDCKRMLFYRVHEYVSDGRYVLTVTQQRENSGTATVA
jgi:hypothetical protein